MNILFLDAYFEPEKTSFSELEKDLLDCFSKSLHKIKIICPTPTRGISEETRRACSDKKLEYRSESVAVSRFYAPKERNQNILRTFRYFWCNLRTIQKASKAYDTDIIFSNSTPPTQGAVCAVVKKKLSKRQKRYVPFIYNLQDIFPDSLVNAGMTKTGSLIYKIGRKIEDYTYKNADKIIVISESFKNNIIEKGVPEEKIEVISNWIDTEAIKPVDAEDNKLFKELNLDKNKFIVTYAGNFGASQGADVIIEAAGILKSENDISFVLFGGGSEFEKIKKAVAEKALTNVYINPLLPAERISEVYSLGDVSVITCKKGAGRAAMPSKTWSIMACNTPIIAAFDTDSDLARILKTSESGICIEPQNPQLLAQTIVGFKNGKYSFKSGRKYVLSNADKKVCTQKYADVVKEVKRACIRR